jgi:hypothetical protein
MLGIRENALVDDIFVYVEKMPASRVTGLGVLLPFGPNVLNYTICQNVGAFFRLIKMSNHAMPYALIYALSEMFSFVSKFGGLIRAFIG